MDWFWIHHMILHVEFDFLDFRHKTLTLSHLWQWSNCVFACVTSICLLLYASSLCFFWHRCSNSLLSTLCLNRLFKKKKTNLFYKYALTLFSFFLLSVFIYLFFCACVCQKTRRDVCNFDKEFTKMVVELTPTDKLFIMNLDQNEFQGFSYTNPEFIIQVWWLPAG